MIFRFSLLSWSAWAPGVDTDEKWHQWAQGDLPIDDEGVPDVADIPMMLRRRLGRLGRMVMRCANDVDQYPNPHLVFSSRYGDSTLTAVLLQALANKEPVSPAKFSVSVHNALAGLLSIYTKNTAPHTAIAAGRHSFLHAMLEAQALLHEDPKRIVLLLHYDEPLPDFYEPFVDYDVPIASLALVLTGNGDANGVKMKLATDDGQATIDDEDSIFSYIRFLTGKKDFWCWQQGEKSWKCMLDVA